MGRRFIEVDEPGTVDQYLFDRCWRFQTRIAQVDAVTTSASVSYADILKRSTVLETLLTSYGLVPGTVAFVVGENNPYYPGILLGVLSTGATAHLVDPRSTPHEIEHHLSITRPWVVLVSKAVWENKAVATSLSAAPTVHRVLIWGADGILESAAVEQHHQASLELQDVLASGSVALVLSSSGSTGLPKGVMLTHANILAALKLGSTFISENDVALGLSPYFHAFGGILMLICLSVGARMVSMSSFSLAGLMDVVHRHEVTVMHVVPSLLGSLAKFPDLDTMSKKMASLKRVWTGAAQVSPLIQQQLQEALPGVKMFHSYGMTESTFTMLVGEVRADKPGSPGTLVPNMECKVVDPESGNAVPTGSQGELYFRGPMVMLGYLRNENATKESLDADGWLRSGDLGYVDDDGYYFYVERIKEMLKYNGHQVSPSELESLIMSHPSVQDVAVIGIPHEFGDVPRAFVVLAEGAALAEEDVCRFIASKVSSYKALRGGVRFTDAIPKTGSGKLQRKKLRELILHELDVSR